MPADLPTHLWSLLGGIGGLIAGSFLAALVLRWPREERVAVGRSRCDGCGVALGVRDLVPLLSYVLVRGRCRRCGGAIDPRHPLIEAAAGLIGAVSLALAPGAEGAAGALFGWALLALAVLDLDHHWLPDALVLPLAGTGVALAAVGIGAPLVDRLAGAVAGYALLEAVRRVYRRARGREGLGGGDPKLFAAIGAWLGWAALPLVLLGASLAGLAVAAGLAATGRAIRADTRLPLGTLLAIAAWGMWAATAGLAHDPKVL